MKTSVNTENYEVYVIKWIRGGHWKVHSHNGGETSILSESFQWLDTFQLQQYLHSDTQVWV